MRVGVKPGQWGWTFEDLRASWEIAEDCGFHHISCFDHVSASPRPLASWDAPSLLVAMAGATTAIGLEVQVLNASLRNPFLLAGQLAMAQAASRGRLQVGVGAGSHHLARFDHAAVGIAFPLIKSAWKGSPGAAGSCPHSGEARSSTIPPWASPVPRSGRRGSSRPPFSWEARAKPSCASPPASPTAGMPQPNPSGSLSSPDASRRGVQRSWVRSPGEGRTCRAEGGRP